MIVPLPSAATICRRRKIRFGAAVLRAGSPVHGCSTIGLAHSRNLSFKPFHAVCAEHVCLSTLPPSHDHSQNHQGPLAALRKTAFTKLRSQHPLRERKKPHPAGGDPPARTESIQELIHQPGAAPPSSSTGRQLNSSGGRILSGSQQSPLNFFKWVAASVFPPGMPGKSRAVAENTFQASPAGER